MPNQHACVGTPLELWSMYLVYLNVLMLCRRYVAVSRCYYNLVLLFGAAWHHFVKFKLPAMAI